MTNNKLKRKCLNNTISKAIKNNVRVFSKTVKNNKNTENTCPHKNSIKCLVVKPINIDKKKKSTL